MPRRKKLNPETFDDLVIETQISGLSGERAFRFRLTVVVDGMEVHLQCVGSYIIRNLRISQQQLVLRDGAIVREVQV